ncbi:MAG: hypothetical protein E7F12_16880 [Clostridioides difficile]|nr:hypothetical protein [Clostridioides difficile]
MSRKRGERNIDTMVLVMYIYATIIVVRGFRYGIKSLLDLILFVPSIFLISTTIINILI